MGDLNREELRNEVKGNLGRSTNDAINERVNKQLHLAQIRIARAHPWTEMYTQDTKSVLASAGSTYTDFPTGLKDIYSLRVATSSDTVSTRLIWVPQRQWDELIGESSLQPTGDVTHYTRWGSTIEWFRTPSENFTLYRRYTTWPVDFTSNPAGGQDVNVSELDNKDDIIISLATSTLFHSLGAVEDAASWFGLAGSALGLAIQEEMQKPDISRVPRRGSGDADVSRVGNYWSDPFVRGVR